MQVTSERVRKCALAVGMLISCLTPWVCAQTQPQEETGKAPAPTKPAEPPAPPPAPIAPLPQATTAPETQSLHIQVGRSVVISTQARLRRILVSNQNVLETATITPTQVAVTAKAPGSSSLVMWDETGHARILDVYADVDVTTFRDTLRQMFPGEPIQAEADEGRIVLTGTVSNKAAADEAARMAANFSKEVINSLIVAPAPHGKQLMLKVRFAEVNRRKLDALGINILSTGAANTPGVISTQQFSPFTASSVTGTIGAGLRGAQTTLNASDLLNIFLFRPDLNLGVTIKALQQKNVLQILAEPNLMARSGEPARFIAGGEFPFPVVQAGGGTNAITIQFRPFGIRLDFTGTVGADNVIRLKVAPEVSSLDFANALTISGFNVPALSTRRAETEIELRDGQSFGIAGLLNQTTTAQFNKIPGIGDIPIIGYLFKSKQLDRSDTELLVLVTPTIVDPLGGAVTPLAAPTMPIENLQPQTFDRSVGKPDAAAPTGTK